MCQPAKERVIFILTTAVTYGPIVCTFAAQMKISSYRPAGATNQIQCSKPEQIRHDPGELGTAIMKQVASTVKLGTDFC